MKAKRIQSREHNPCWRGGRTVRSDGYVLLLVGVTHHLADARGYAFEHRVVAEQMLGRKLLAGEVVHHGPGGRSDNRPANLRIKQSHSLHMKEEHGDPGRFREMQQRGAVAKHNKLLRETLPSVVAGIRSLMDSGVKPTQRACRSIPKYTSIQRHFSQTELIAMAEKL